MARADTAPWVPGYIVLSDDDLKGRNPYTGGILAPNTLKSVMEAIGYCCFVSDDSIQQAINTVSKSK